MIRLLGQSRGQATRLRHRGGEVSEGALFMPEVHRLPVRHLHVPLGQHNQEVQVQAILFLCVPEVEDQRHLHAVLGTIIKFNDRLFLFRPPRSTS